MCIFVGNHLLLISKSFPATDIKHSLYRTLYHGDVPTWWSSTLGLGLWSIHLLRFHSGVSVHTWTLIRRILGTPRNRTGRGRIGGGMWQMQSV